MTSHGTALITGAATGIGRACVERLARQGFAIAACYRSRRQETEALLEQLPGSGHRALQADVADPEQASALVSETVSGGAPLEVLVNAAGLFTQQELLSGDYEEWTRRWMESLGANLLGPVNLARQAALHMKERGRGTIVNISSRGAFRGEPDAPAYGAAKSGLNSASQSLAVKLAPHGVRVFAIAPGWVDTPMAAGRIPADVAEQIPLGRVGQPEEIADLVHYLVTGQTDYLTGAIFDANGASHLRN